jgi:glycosyltransferase involved in cell wall biosynthesis
MEFLVSICCMAKDLENYISDAVEGFLKQVVNFNYQIVLSDDCSTDNTLAICKRYKDQYPDKITVLSSETRLGLEENFVKTLKACSGKYVAFCDGDDYWTDPLKLQKQIDYLEANAGCSLICSDYDYINTEGIYEISNWKKEHYSKKFNFFDEYNHSIATTLTVVIRKWALDPLIDSIVEGEPHPFIYDTVLWGYCLNNGYGYFFPEKTAIRRVLSSGDFTSRKAIHQLTIEAKCIVSLKQLIKDHQVQVFLNQKLYTNQINIANTLFKDKNKREARKILRRSANPWMGIGDIKLNFKSAYNLLKSYVIKVP